MTPEQQRLALRIELTRQIVALALDRTRAVIDGLADDPALRPRFVEAAALLASALALFGGEGPAKPH